MQQRLTRKDVNKKQKNFLYRMRNYRIREIKLMKEKIGIYNQEIDVIDDRIRKFKQIDGELEG